MCSHLFLNASPGAMRYDVFVQLNGVSSLVLQIEFSINYLDLDSTFELTIYKDMEEGDKQNLHFLAAFDLIAMSFIK